MAVAVQSTLDSIVDSKTKYDVAEAPMQFWDKGVFLNEVQRLGLVLQTSQNGVPDGDLVTNKPIQQGTYAGTRMALTELKNMFDEAYVMCCVGGRRVERRFKLLTDAQGGFAVRHHEI